MLFFSSPPRLGILLLTLLLVSGALSSVGAFEATFFDLPEGEAILIKSQGRWILIDARPAIACDRLLRGLKDRGVRELDYLIVTHPHPDHYSGIFCLTGFLYPRRLADNGQKIPPFPKDDFLRWYATWRQKHPRYRFLSAGETLKIGEIVIQVLWPPSLSGNYNADSLVLMVKEKKGRLLLTGDIPASVEKTLVEDYGSGLRAQVLKVSHHGAADASSEVFLKYVSPQVAVVCAGRNHPRGYPAKRVLERLKRLVPQVLVTGDQGTLSVVISPSGEVQWRSYND
ncbi:MAG TPA: MBL fold metallo-hydrolase [Thermodesulfatator sp.]|nr:MBL fold metallo-hydrolase [Thermodesulfatator sp.]